VKIYVAAVEGVKLSLPPKLVEKTSLDLSYFVV
jgi:hypothetical protein